ncbi:MAG: hypothetical protein ABSC25_11075 [Roseiarcus sp.]|jgi:hypothetical protein
MTNGVLRPSMRALALAASFALAMPTAASALPASSPMTVAATAGGSHLVTPAAWRHYGGWRGRGGYGWGPGGALFAGAALGILGLAVANSYDYGYACDPYDYYGSCGPYYGGPAYAYGYPYGGYGYYGYGRGFAHYRGFAGPRFAHFGGGHWMRGRR